VLSSIVVSVSRELNIYVLPAGTIVAICRGITNVIVNLNAPVRSVLSGKNINSETLCTRFTRIFFFIPKFLSQITSFLSGPRVLPTNAFPF